MLWIITILRPITWFKHLQRKAESFIQVLKLTGFRVRRVMENLEKSWNFKMVISGPGKVLGGKNPQRFGKVIDICYIHMCIYAEF